MGFGFLAAGSGIRAPVLVATAPGGPAQPVARGPTLARAAAASSSGEPIRRGGPARRAVAELTGSPVAADHAYQPGVFACGNSCAAPQDDSGGGQFPDHRPTRTCWRGWRASRTRCPAVSRTAVLYGPDSPISVWALLQDNSKPAGDSCRGVADARRWEAGWPARWPGLMPRAATTLARAPGAVRAPAGGLTRASQGVSPWRRRRGRRLPGRVPGRHRRGGSWRRPGSPAARLRIGLRGCAAGFRPRGR